MSVRNTLNDAVPDVSPLSLALIIFVVVGAAMAILQARSAPAVYPIGDIAVIETYTQEASAGHLLEGPYSRFGWHHPGPIYFYLLAPAYVLGGGTTAALSAGALALSLAVIALVVWVTARTGGAAVSASFLMTITAMAWRLDGLLVSVWNPHIILLPAVCLIVLGAALWCGNFYALPIAAIVATFLVQTHVALTLYAAAILGVSMAAGLIAIRRRSRPGPRDPRRSLFVTGLLIVLLWTPPLAEQVVHTPGNLTALWQFFVVHPGGGQRFAAATAVWTMMLPAVMWRELHLPYGGTLAPELNRWHILATAAILTTAIVAAVYAFRTRRTVIGALATLSIVGAVATWCSATRIDGVANDHMIFWFAAVGASSVAVSAATLLTWGLGHAGSGFRVRRVSAALVHVVPLGALLWMGWSQMDRARQGHFAVTILSTAVPNFAASIRGYMRAGGVHRPIIRVDQDKWGLTAGILLELQREGVPFAVEDSWAAMFPARFHARGDEDAELTFAAAGTMPELATRPGNVTIDSSGQIHVEAVRLPRKSSEAGRR